MPSLGRPIGEDDSGISLGSPIGEDETRRPAKKRKKKRKKKRSGGKRLERKGNIFSNALDEIGGFATEAGPGLVQLGSSVGSDLRTGLQNLSGPLSRRGQPSRSYQLDDVGSALRHSYTDEGTFFGEGGRIAPALLRGNVGDAQRHARNTAVAFHNRPVGPILDVTAALSGGASIAGKVGQAAAKTAKSGQGGLRGAAIRSAGYVPATRESARMARRAGYTAEEMGRSYVPGVREVGKRAEAAGRINKTVPLRQHRNPYSRAMQSLRDPVWDAISGVPSAVKRKGVGSPGELAALGSGVRFGRVERKQERNAAQRRRNQYLAPAARVAATLDPEERKAWELMHSGADPSEYRAMYLDDSTVTGELTDADRVARAAEAASVTDRVVDLVSNPTRNLQTALKYTRRLADEQMHNLIIDAGFMGSPADAQRALLARQTLVRDVTKGARSVDKHPQMRWSDVRKEGRIIETRRPRTRDEAEAMVVDLEKVVKSELRGSKGKLIDLFNRAKGTAMPRTGMKKFEGAPNAVDIGHGKPKGRKMLSNIPVATDAAWHYLRELADDKPDVDPGDAGRAAGVVIRDRAELEQLMDSVGVTPDKARRLIRAADDRDLIRAELDRVDDPFNDPSSPFYDEASADARPGEFGEVSNITVEPTAAAVAASKHQKRGHVPLRDIRDAQGQRVYRDTELAEGLVAKNRGGRGELRAGTLLADERADLPLEELQRQAEGASYFPLRAERKGRGPVSVGQGRGKSVVNDPMDASVLFKQATDFNLLRARQAAGPQALFDTAEQLFRLAQSHAVFQRMMSYGVKPTREMVDSGDFVLINGAKRQGLARQYEEASAALEKIRAFAGDDAALGGLAEQYAESIASMLTDTPGKGTVAVPREVFDTVTGDLHGTNRVAKVLIDKPLDVFRWGVLKIRPAWMVNDIVGSHVLLGIRHGGPRIVKSYVDYIAKTKGPAAADRLLRRMVNDPTQRYAWDGVIDQWAGEIWGQSFIAREGSASGRAPGLRQRTMRAALYVPDKIAELDRLLSSDVPRAALFIKLMHPHVRDARAANPRIWKNAADHEIASSLLESNPALRDHIVERTLADLVDYSSLTPFERNVIRRAVPFYSWTRGLTLWMLELGLQDPWRMNLFIQKPSIVGAEHNEDRDLPSFMRGLVFTDDDRAFNTLPMNPIGTFGGVAQMIGGDQQSGSNTLASQLGGPAAWAIQGITNRDSFTGYQLPEFGQLRPDYSQAPKPGLIPWLGRLAWQPVTDFALANPALYHGSESGVYGGTGPGDYWKGYMGLPMRNVQLGVAAQRAEEERARRRGEQTRF